MLYVDGCHAESLCVLHAACMSMVVLTTSGMQLRDAEAWVCLCSHCTIGADVRKLKLLRCVRFLDSAKLLLPRTGWIPAVEMQAESFGATGVASVDLMKLQERCINWIQTQ